MFMFCVMSARLRVASLPRAMLLLLGLILTLSCPSAVGKANKNNKMEHHALEAHSVEAFDVLLRSRLHDVIIVDFYAPWCGHCKVLAPEFDKAHAMIRDMPAPFNDSVLVVKVDAEKLGKLKTRYKLKSYPSIRVFRRDEGTGKMPKQPEIYSGDRFATNIVRHAAALAGAPMPAVKARGWDSAAEEVAGAATDMAKRDGRGVFVHVQVASSHGDAAERARRALSHAAAETLETAFKRVEVTVAEGEAHAGTAALPSEAARAAAENPEGVLLALYASTANRSKPIELRMSENDSTPPAITCRFLVLTPDVTDDDVVAFTAAHLWPSLPALTRANFHSFMATKTPIIICAERRPGRVDDDVSSGFKAQCKALRDSDSGKMLPQVTYLRFGIDAGVDAWFESEFGELRAAEHPVTPLLSFVRDAVSKFVASLRPRPPDTAVSGDALAEHTEEAASIVLFDVSTRLFCSHGIGVHVDESSASAEMSTMLTSCDVSRDASLVSKVVRYMEAFVGMESRAYPKGKIGRYFKYARTLVVDGQLQPWQLGTATLLSVLFFVRILLYVFSMWWKTVMTQPGGVGDNIKKFK